MKNETNALYLKGISCIKEHRYRIVAVVCDGHHYLMQNLSKYPVQLCQYHQLKTIQRYIPKNAKHPPAQHLRLIASMLTEITKEQLDDFLEQ